MKLHLPIALLSAVVSAASYGADGSYTYQDGTGMYSYSEINGTDAMFSKDTSIWFTGDWTNSIFNTNPAINLDERTGYFDKDRGDMDYAHVGGLLPSSATETANNISIKVGTTATDEPQKTIISTLYGVGHAGYASIGNKNILVTGISSKDSANYTYVGTLIGGNNLSDGTSAGYDDSSYEENNINISSLRFAKKSDTDKSISILVEGGVVGQIRGGNSGHSGKIDTAIGEAWTYYGKLYDNAAEVRAAVESYVDNGPWIRNEKVDITIAGDSKVGYNQAGEAYESGAEASIYGAGGTSNSINNTVSITIKGDADILGNVLGGAVGTTYTIQGNKTNVNAYVTGTEITIDDNATINGNIYGGGYSKKESTSTVKGDTTIVLAGGAILKNVYGAGVGDLVEGNTKVVIQGAGSNVSGTIYGGGTNGSVVKGDKILAFNEYTGNSVDWTKYGDFNALEISDSKLNLGVVSKDFLSLDLTGADVTADSLRDGEAIKLTGSSHLYINDTDFSANKAVAPSLVVNDAVKLAAGSDYTGTPEYDFLELPAATAKLTAHSVTTEGAVNFEYAEITATTGNISLGAGSTVTETNLIAENGTVKLTNSTMNGGDIVAKSFFNDGSDTVVDSVTVSSDVLSEATSPYGNTYALLNTGNLTIAGDLNLSNSCNAAHVSAGHLAINGDVNGLHTFYQSGGSVDFGGNVKLSTIFFMDGTMEFSGAEGTLVVQDTEAHFADNSKILHSGDGNVSFNSIFIYDNVEIRQTGNGEMRLGSFSYFMNEMTSHAALNIIQDGSGRIINSESLIATSGIDVNVSLTGGGSFENRGSATITSITTSDNGGKVINIEDGNLTVRGDATGADFEQNSTGKLTFEGNMSGTITQSAGAVEFAGGKDTIANVTQVFATGGKLVHSGSGDIVVDDIVNFDFIDGKSYTIEQSGTGSLTVNNSVSDLGGGIDIIQTGAGQINLKGVAASSDDNLNIKQSGGGTLSNSGELSAKNVEVFNGSELENSGSMQVTNTLALSQSAITNSGKMDIDNLAIADGSITITNTGEGNMVIGSVDGVTANAIFVQNGTGTLTFAGDVKNNDMGLGGAIKLQQTGGTVEFAGKEGTSAVIHLEGDCGVAPVVNNTGTLLHSGNGDVEIKGSAERCPHATPIGSQYTINQTGNGKLRLDGDFHATATQVAINQTGKGRIELAADFYVPLNDSTLSVTQANGGTVSVETDGIFYSVDVSNGSTFENHATVGLYDIALTEGATLYNAGQMTILDELSIQDATLAFVVGDGFTNGDVISSSAALTLGAGASITAMDNVAFHLIFDNEEVLAQKGENYGWVDFSVTVMSGLTGLTEAESAEIDSLVGAVKEGALTLSLMDANGNEIDLKLKEGSQLTFDAETGSVVLSGSMVIPEPTTATLSLLALAALAARRRRK